MRTRFCIDPWWSGRGRVRPVFTRIVARVVAGRGRLNARRPSTTVGEGLPLAGAACPPPASLRCSHPAAASGDPLTVAPSLSRHGYAGSLGATDPSVVGISNSSASPL